MRSVTDGVLRVGSRALIVAVLFVAVASACAPGESVPPRERRAQEVNRAVMCPVCPGESIDQSQNPLAIQMRGIVNVKLDEGWSEQQIKDFFVERYGPSVLLEPPSEGLNLLVWVLPPIGVVGAGLILFFGLRMMTRGRVSRRAEVLKGVRLSEQEREEYFRRVDAALEAETGRGGEAKDPATPS